MEYKSIGLSPDTYEMLLHKKHDFEKDAGTFLSFDEVVKKLIELANGGGIEIEKVGSA